MFRANNKKIRTKNKIQKQDSKTRFSGTEK